jgi:1-acyl-sn-glycerol-3-phosphate acyltransferase
VNREQILGELSRMISAWGAGDEPTLERLLAEALARFDDAALAAARGRVEHTGEAWDYHPPDPVGRAVSRAVMGHVLQSETELVNEAALRIARRAPVVLLGNHLSFVDVNVLDSLMAAAGYDDVAERVTALVGPKVFSVPIRRLASLCFGTIKLPQSQQRASGEARMSSREAARLAVRAIQVARERQRHDDHLLIFPEGTRSRGRALVPLLPAVARYLEHPGSWIVPWAHHGSEHLVPIDDERVHPTSVRVCIGRPQPAAVLLERCHRRRPLVANVIGFLIADLLPEPYRGAYEKGEGELETARKIATELGPVS